MAIESERKYLDVNFGILEDRLRELGATTRGPHFETNVILDLPDNHLFGQNKLLRIRKQEWPERTICKLTFKKPLPEKKFCASCSHLSGIPALTNEKDTKIREELEVEIGSFETALALFSELGYRPHVYYEKIRQTYLLEGSEDKASHMEQSPVKVELDRLSFISVVEVEGSIGGIERTERLLGLDKFKKSSTNYHSLYQDWLIKQQLPLNNNFVFEEPLKTELRLQLGLN